MSKKSLSNTRFATYAGLTFLVLWLSALMITRFANLALTARFTQDESSDLARMYSYWRAKKITLVGPISNDNEKVFGSLTYYLQLPFAALYQFAPVGPVVATAFWGTLTVLMLALIVVFWINPKKRHSDQNKEITFTIFKDKIIAIGDLFTHSSVFQNHAFIYLLLALTLIVIWNPLLMTSRWAWNPHLIPFWLVLAVFIDFFKIPYKNVWIGLFLGLSIHHHYLAVFASGSYLLSQLITYCKQKKYHLMVELGVGYFLAILPFIIFDLRHPPGLFFGKYIFYRTPHVVAIHGWQWIENLLRNLSQAITIIGSFRWTQFILIPLILGLIGLDWISEKKRLKWLVPVFAQIGGCLVLEEFNHRYFLPGLVFFLLWLLVPRMGMAFKLWLIIMLTLIFVSFWQLPAELSEPQNSPSMLVVTQAAQEIATLIELNPQMKNYKVVALTGLDMDALAIKYRDLLSIKNIHFKATSEYDTSEHLFVISDQDEVRVRADKNYAMTFFNHAEIKQIIPLETTPWKIYLFSFK